MKKILFITHNTTLTGAPYILLLFLKWLKKEHKEIKIDIVFLEKGDLYKSFEELANTSYDYSNVLAKKTFLHKVYYFLINKIAKKNVRKEQFIKKILQNKYDVIYANTIVSVEFATKLKDKSKNNPKLIAHIHELNTVIKEYLPNFQEYVPKIDQFISVSNLVMQNLNSNWNVKPQKNHLIYEFSDKIVSKNPSLSNDQSSKKVLQVGASGLVHWRKGDDLFIQVANYIKNQYPEIQIKFTWVGQISDKQRNIIEADLEKANLKDTVFFVGQQINPEIYFQNFDVFLMTSREDPFPLVCIEVGKMGIPIICFEKATGTAEIIANRGGFVVPYLDCKAMAEKLVLYDKDPSLMQQHGNLNKVDFATFVSDVMAEKIYTCIKNIS